MAGGIAEVMRARHLPDPCPVRPHRALQRGADRNDYAQGETDLDAKEEDAEQRKKRRRTVSGRVFPCFPETGEIGQLGDSHQDGRGQGRLGQEVEERRQEDRDQKDDRRREDAGERGLRAGGLIDDRAGKTAGDWITARQGRRRIGRAEAEQFAVRIDAFAPPCGQGLADRDAFDEADQGDQRRRPDQGAPDIKADDGQLQRRQAARQGADHGQISSGIEMQPPGDGGRQYDEAGRGSAGDAAGHVFAQLQRRQQARQYRARRDQESDAADPDYQRHQIDRGQLRAHRQQDFRQGRAVGVDAEDMLGLAGDDQNRRGGDKGAHHGPAEEIGDTAELEQAEQEQEKTRQRRQRAGGGHLLRRIGQAEIADRCRRHQRDHGDGPDSEHTARAEQGVGDQRCDRGIKPRLRRQAGEQGIGKALRDQQDGRDQARQRILAKGAAAIAFQPLQAGQHPFGALEELRLH